MKQEKTTKREYPTMTESQLRTFNDTLQKFRVTRVLSSGKETSFVDAIAYLKSVGALGRNGGVVMRQDEFGAVTAPVTYEVENNKLDQWENWLRRKEYGEQKTLEGLDEVAQQMTVEKLSTDGFDNGF